METTFEAEALQLYEQTVLVVDAFKKARDEEDDSALCVTAGYGTAFFHLIDRVNLSLLEDKDNFFGYFFIHMGKEIRFDLASPTGVNFKSATYVMYFNPLLFLRLTKGQMESCLKHEILHIVSLHLLRARDLRNDYSKLAVNLAMDTVVNTYLSPLQPDAITLAWVNTMYRLALKPFESFEYYADAIQEALDKRRPLKDTLELDSETDEKIKTSFDPKKAHDIWDDSDEIDDSTLQKFTEKYVEAAQKGHVSNYLKSMIDALKYGETSLPWHYFLKKLVGSVTSEFKKTMTRRNRRQPERLDLRGRLRNHKANIFIALDISGSISDAEFKQAMKEVFEIVHCYNHEITIIECDNRIRRVYPVEELNDLKERLNIRGGTQFTPVIEYANDHPIDLLVYFTDGKGEEHLEVKPRGYKILWVISGKGDKLSVDNPCGIVKKLNPLKLDDPLPFDDVEKGGFSANNQESASMPF
ncbi:MAG: VWA-like domain-containing protein [Megasphaera sp.]|jgi:predicted metal-dependent peptidase|nr:VWA-like domain-containing protein [Megasphaera sp.]MCH4187395.1 VWA-like domain-containing protein [Megasphaera sp.]MCH4217577.1 VWA-like domain-containing protein [Megasphaera sp.]